MLRTRWRARAAAAMLAALLPAGAGAQMYDDATLLAAWEQTGDNITLMITEDIAAVVPESMRARAARIGVVFEARAAHPLYFYARPDAGTVHVPIASVRFVDDLATLVAWVDRKGCAPEYVQTYLWALLREGRALPPPLAAFGIDRDAALADPWVNDVSGKILKSALFFIFAHEVGHLLLGHTGGLEGADSQAQEIAADAFALDRFAALGTPPAGIVLYFMATRWLEPGAAAAGDITHPVSPDRLRAVADRLAADPAAFSFSEPDPAAGRARVETFAAEFRTMADMMAGDAMLTLLPAGLSRDFPVARLAAACPS